MSLLTTALAIIEKNIKMLISRKTVTLMGGKKQRAFFCTKSLRGKMGISN